MCTRAPKIRLHCRLICPLYTWQKHVVSFNYFGEAEREWGRSINTKGMEWMGEHNGNVKDEETRRIRNECGKKRE